MPPAAYVYRYFELPGDTIAIDGMVRSLGHCAAGSAALAGVQIEIAGADGTFTVETDGVGYYQALLPESEAPFTVGVTVPGHLPAVFEGIDIGGGGVLAIDIDLVLDAPCATADPGEVDLALPADTAAAFEVTIGNFDGGTALDWSVGTAISPFLATGSSIVDCEGDLGLIVHDDGIVNNGYTSGNPAIEEIVFVDRFTPAAYPAAFRAVCIGLFSLGPRSLDFEIVIFDNDGGQGGQVGSPGTELGALQVAAEDIPVVSTPLPPDLEPTWFKFDITSLDVVIESGSVFIGARWQPVAPTAPDVVIAADEGQGTRGGGWWWNHLDQWVPMGVLGSFPSYRSLFIRAAENLGGCHDTAELPWLSVAPASGTVPAGGGDVVQATVNTYGLAPGGYSASLCIETGDPSEPLLVVPVRLTVSDEELAPGVITADPPEIAFEDVIVGTALEAEVTVINAGEPGAAALLLLSLAVDGSPAFEIAGGDCAVGTLLEAGASCTAVVGFQPLEAEFVTAVLSVSSIDGQAVSIDLAGAGIDPQPPENEVFDDRFESK